MPADHFHLAWSRIQYEYEALGAHGLHSPFVYQMYQDCIRKKRKSIYPPVENLRKLAKRSGKKISVTDFKSGLTRTKPVKQEARSSPSSPVFSAFLCRLLNYLGARSVLETGTSLGFNTLYLAQSEVQEVWTIEGNPEIAQLAAAHFASLNSTKIHQVVGDLHETLPGTIAQAQPDVVFLDADHRSQAIFRCLDSLSDQLKEIKCIIIHDIYWSKDMTSCWQALVRDARFPLTIDLHQAGLLFPNMEMEKQHFRVKFNTGFPI